MTLGLIGGPLQAARHPEKLRLGISTHFYAADTSDDIRAVLPYYHAYLRPKSPGGRGFVVSPAQFHVGIQPGQALMMGTTEQITAKILDAHPPSAASTASGAASHPMQWKPPSPASPPRSHPPSAQRCDHVREAGNDEDPA